MRKHSLFKLIRYFYSPYVYLFSGISVCGLCYVIFEGIHVAAVFPIVNTLIGTDTLQSGSSVIKFTQNFVNFLPVQDKFIAVFLLFLLLNVFINIFRYLYEALTDVSSYVIMRDFQKKLYEKVIASDYQYFLDNKHGELMYRTFTAPGQMIRIFFVIPKLIIESARFLFIMIVLFTISFKLTMGMVVIGFLLYILSKVLAERISYNTGKGRVLESSRQNVLASEAIGGIRQLKVFSASEKWINDFFKASDNFARFAIKDSLYIPLPKSVLSTIAMAFISLSAIFMKMTIGSSFVEFLPTLGVYFYAFVHIVPSMSAFGQMHMHFMGGLPYAEVVYDEMLSDSRKMQDGAIALESFKDSIRFDSVSFTYPARHKTLKDINLVFKKGRITALVGPSGAGKSTIIDLIVRLYNPDSGRILIDGKDISGLSLRSWLDKIGFVSQDTFVFNATIAENISFARDGYNLDDVIEASKVANAHDFIISLPQGYDTVVGDRGLKLSGGQRQRLAIARAIFRKPEILIFDEATSSLDSETEKEVQNAIEKISKQKTVIVVAHRLSTVIGSDDIIVIKEGSIAEEGSHNFLMSKKGLYWRLYNEQVKFAEV